MSPNDWVKNDAALALSFLHITDDMVAKNLVPSATREKMAKACSSFLDKYGRGISATYSAGYISTIIFISNDSGIPVKDVAYMAFKVIPGYALPFLGLAEEVEPMTVQEMEEAFLEGYNG